MTDKDEFDLLRRAPLPKPGEDARNRALLAAMAAYDEEKSRLASQGSRSGSRLTDRVGAIWSTIMNIKLIPAPAALAGLLVIPVAGYLAVQLATGVSPFAIGERGAPDPTVTNFDATPKPAEAERDLSDAIVANEAAGSARKEQPVGRTLALDGTMRARQPAMPGGAAALDVQAMPEENRDRIEGYQTNPVRDALSDPVSTFAIDVDTASWSWVRRQLNRGQMPDVDTVRVEEMVNYFPYGWAGPESAATPFKSNVTLMPTPWNEHTRLMHIAIKGYDLVPATRPKSNLVFLIDTSGSMNQPDKLPLLVTAFKMMLDKLAPDDTVSIVTYAGTSGVALEPTKAGDKAKIAAALERLGAEGSTAGASGIAEAYRLARANFIDGGVNRVMLATDGDFNVGPSDDDSLKKLIEKERKSGIYLSVFGFGAGNYNDQLMQVLAQNGNGIAAYIDTVSEARKAFVEQSAANLFTIAKDVKIQVEFNPEKIAEYRLIGYETRALNREDFNNDRVDAGDIGSGHSVTAIYEVTPKGSPATLNDPLRYQQGEPQAGPNSELAFVKIRYKAPDSDTSQLIETPVTDEGNAIARFEDAGEDQRFSVAVAAFGQKLRDTDALAGYGYDKIADIAARARGEDPFGYRAEFLQMVRVAESLSKN